MTEFTGIAYEPHPVTPERKAELRAQGYRIIDAQFKPVTPHGDEDSPAIDVGTLTAAATDASAAPARKSRGAK